MPEVVRVVKGDDLRQGRADRMVVEPGARPFSEDGPRQQVGVVGQEDSFLEVAQKRLGEPRPRFRRDLRPAERGLFG